MGSGVERQPQEHDVDKQARHPDDESGVKRDALVELLDKVPTLLELAGLEVPDRMPGRSLRPLLRQGVADEHHRDFVRSEYCDAVDMPAGTFATMYRDRRYKLVVYHGHQHGDLYDLVADPDEFENLWDKPGVEGLKIDLMKRSTRSWARFMMNALDPDIEAEVMRVLDKWQEAFSQQDMEAWETTYHFPHYRLGRQMMVLSELGRRDTESFKRLEATGWHYS